MISLLISVLFNGFQVSVPRLQAVTELRIPSEGAGYSLSLVTEAVPLDQGGIAILEPRDARISVFDSGGRFVRSFGRAGQGPGEYISPSWLMRRGDTLMVSDVGTNRLTVMLTSGRVLRSFRLPRSGDGVFQSFRRILVVPVRVVSAFERADAHLVFQVVDRAGRVQDTILNIPNTPRILRYVRGGGLMVGLQPLDDQPLYDIQRDASAVVVIERAVRPEAPHEVVLRRVQLDGRVTLLRRMSYEPAVVPSIMVDSQVAQLIRSGPPVSGGNLEERIRRGLFVPSHLPSVTAVIAATDGVIWLRREETTTDLVRWTRLDRNGRLTGELMLRPRARVVSASNDHLWVIEPSEVDLPEIVRYRVERLPG